MLSALFKKASLALVAWLAFFAPAYAAVSEQTLSIAGLEVAAELPQNLKDAPIVLLSHGITGCNIQFRYLMHALAEAGYAVFAPNHQDKGCNNPLFAQIRPPVPFASADLWSEKIYKDRMNDIEVLLLGLQSDEHLRTLNWNKIGIVGHSLGGYTALGLAGAWPEWKDKRIKAVVALSPYSAPFLSHHTIGNIDIPVMYQGGSKDDFMTIPMLRENGTYEQTRSAKIFLEFKDANHLAWLQSNPKHHQSIIAYSVAFFDYALRGKVFPPELGSPHGDVDIVKTSLLQSHQN